VAPVAPPGPKVFVTLHKHISNVGAIVGTCLFCLGSVLILVYWYRTVRARAAARRLGPPPELPWTPQRLDMRKRREALYQFIEGEAALHNELARETARSEGRQAASDRPPPITPGGLTGAGAEGGAYNYNAAATPASVNGPPGAYTRTPQAAYSGGLR